MCVSSWVLPAFLLEQSWVQGSGGHEHPALPYGSKCWKLLQIPTSARSETSCLGNISHLSSCTLWLQCQWESSPRTDGLKTKPWFHLTAPALEGGARTRGGWPTPSLAVPNYPHSAQGSTTTSVTVLWLRGAQQGWGTPAPTWVCPSPRFVLSSVDILL